MHFDQVSTYIKTVVKKGKEDRQRFTYSRGIGLYPLSSQSKNKVYYNKDLKINIESMESYNTYEIEVIEPVMEFGSEIRKAEDFHRRLNYKYDWIHVERSSNGKITDVGNLKELRTNWNLLKERVERDYEGVAVDKYLNGISDRFVRDEHFKSIFSQYNEYGLLFPVVPKKHRNDWNMQRIITLDDNEKSELVETITFVNEDEEFRIYDLKLDRNETSSINIIESAGEIVLSKKDNLIESVDVSVKYFYDEIINNEWVFMLKRV